MAARWRKECHRQDRVHKYMVAVKMNKESNGEKDRKRTEE